MNIGEYDEKRFLKEIVSKYATTASSLEFDDCIVIDLGKIIGKKDLPYIVYSMDHPSFIKRSVNDDENYRFYGRWVAAIVCGDVLAMGARPLGFSVDIAAPLEMETKKIELILSGIRDVLDKYGTQYEGGNFDENVLEMVGMSWGLVDSENIIRRKGAREGDIIAVTTTLGYGWAEYLSRKLYKTNVLSDETLEKYKVFKEMPIAPSTAIVAAAKTSAITSGMDVSDGIIEFLYTIREKNNLGAKIIENWIEVTPEMEEVAGKILNVRPTLLALEPGYDTPLGHTYTINPVKWELVEKVFEENGSKLYKIGIVEKGSSIVLETKTGKNYSLPPFWDDQFSKGDRISQWFEMVKTF